MKLISQLFSQKFVKCQEQLSGIDNPENFAHLDGQYRVEDEESTEQLGLDPRVNSRKPPQFQSLLNNVRAITKKVEHIKGFKFEYASALSQNFHFALIWNIPYSSAGDQAQEPKGNPMMAMQKPPATSNCCLQVQYVGGEYIDLQQGKPKFILTGRMDSDGKLDAAIIKQLSKNWNFTFASNFPFGSDTSVSQVNVDLNYEDNNSITSFKYTTGALGFGHMQTIGNRLFAGFETLFGLQQSTIFMSYGAKYVHKSHSIIAQHVAGQGQSILGYQFAVKRGTFIVSELCYNTRENFTETILVFFIFILNKKYIGIQIKIQYF
ncbi:hypothetical protein IMG5_147660 [Ichthyophthirius multifiliis]|uniref:Eukaryotic porin family protein n=1 Tax=Ichthyophthirius multifiliis TaxID=5932 RepID=G0QY63_ICHMU|nr:hypothetical protein IMG5_147660 [Ichthyophthirius multifiliis]EGR29837.1 hypothetical protein IMG5_147660 [Ichthyophthirius multifiliis]|eukprot:XP_004031073.1 hypothetical protein IMG5_147660 [Ichthyophthirius multifiliis]